ncbi:hypothetical protein R5R35_012209 [Gryllus longicercus]|uniref:Uncharacterized protein n=1 Tax=Gryllus longicercus TaxID=2509291 RepID=A0AAN9YT83_9ORTH
MRPAPRLCSLHARPRPRHAFAAARYLVSRTAKWPRTPPSLPPPRPLDRPPPTQTPRTYPQRHHLSVRPLPSSSHKQCIILPLRRLPAAVTVNKIQRNLYFGKYRRRFRFAGHFVWMVWLILLLLEAMQMKLQCALFTLIPVN